MRHPRFRKNSTRSRTGFDTVRRSFLVHVVTLFELLKRPDRERISALERGFTASQLQELSDTLGLSRRQIKNGLSLGARRRRGRFTLGESERLLRVASLHAQLRAIFTTDAAVGNWLVCPTRGLNQRTPLALLVTDLGSINVSNLVKAMAQGVPP